MPGPDCSRMKSPAHLCRGFNALSRALGVGHFRLYFIQFMSTRRSRTQKGKPSHVGQSLLNQETANSSPGAPVCSSALTPIHQQQVSLALSLLPAPPSLNYRLEL